jgi:hypothetical protein
VAAGMINFHPPEKFGQQESLSLDCKRMQKKIAMHMGMRRDNRRKVMQFDM